MKKIVFIIMVLAVAMLEYSCSGRVHTAFDKKVDFKKYKSFCWMQGCEFTIAGPAYVNDEKIRDFVKKAIIENLKSKGLVYDSDMPDLLVDFRITLEQETSVVHHVQENEPFYYKPLDEHQVIHFLKGTMVIDFVDKKEARMVWRSQAVGYMEERPDLTYKNIYRGIKRTLKDYPPKLKIR